MSGWGTPSATHTQGGAQQAPNQQQNYNYDPNYAQQYYSYYDPTYYQYYQQYYQGGGVNSPQTSPAIPTTPTTPTANNPLSSAPADITTCKSLYVGNINPSVNEHLLFEIFSSIGTIESCKLIKDKITGLSAGYGFVVCADHATAFVAIQQFNGRSLYGQDLKVNWAFQSGQKTEDTSTHFHIFVGDLSPEIEDKTLHDAFSAFGPISAARVMRDLATSRTRGYGFVAFRNKDDAERALTSMNGEWLGSRPIRCNWANNKGAPGLDAKHEQMSGQGSSITQGMMASQQQATIGPQPPPHLQQQQQGSYDYYQQQQYGYQQNQHNGLSYPVVVNQSSPFNMTIYVGNVPPDCSEHLLRQFFAEYGIIVDVKIKLEKGCAFIKYATHEEAAKAICGGHGKNMGGKIIKCSWGKEPPGMPPQMPMAGPMQGYPYTPYY